MVADPNKRLSPGLIVSLYADLAACAAAVMLSAWAYLSLPERDPLRLLVSAPMLVFVPGYLLVEAFRSSRQPFKRRVLSAAVAPGATIALLGLLALSTAVLPGGFRPDSIVTIVTLACIGLVAAASYHRARILSSPTVEAPPRVVEPMRRPARKMNRPIQAPPIQRRAPPRSRPESRPNGLPPSATGAAELAAKTARPHIVQTGRG